MCVCVPRAFVSCMHECVHAFVIFLLRTSKYDLQVNKFTCTSYETYTHTHTHTHTQDIDDLEYHPTQQEDVSDIEIIEDWEAEEEEEKEEKEEKEKENEEEKKRGHRSSSAHSSKITATHVPLGYSEYQELVKEVCEGLWGSGRVLEGWRPQSADWARVERG